MASSNAGGGLGTPGGSANPLTASIFISAFLLDVCLSPIVSAYITSIGSSFLECPHEPGQKPYLALILIGGSLGHLLLATIGTVWVQKRETDWVAVGGQWVASSIAMTLAALACAGHCTNRLIWVNNVIASPGVPTLVALLVLYNQTYAIRNRRALDYLHQKNVKRLQRSANLRNQIQAAVLMLVDNLDGFQAALKNVNESRGLYTTAIENFTAGRVQLEDVIAKHKKLTSMIVMMLDAPDNRLVEYLEMVKALPASKHPIYRVFLAQEFHLVSLLLGMAIERACQPVLLKKLCIDLSTSQTCLKNLDPMIWLSNLEAIMCLDQVLKTEKNRGAVPPNRKEQLSKEAEHFKGLPGNEGEVEIEEILGVPDIERTLADAEKHLTSRQYDQAAIDLQVLAKLELTKKYTKACLALDKTPILKS